MTESESGASGRGRGRASNAEVPGSNGSFAHYSTQLSPPIVLSSAANTGTSESLLTKRKLDSLTGQIQQQTAGGTTRVDHITLSPEVAEVSSAFTAAARLLPISGAVRAGFRLCGECRRVRVSAGQAQEVQDIRSA